MSNENENENNTIPMKIDKKKERNGLECKQLNMDAEEGLVVSEAPPT